MDPQPTSEDDAFSLFQEGLDAIEEADLDRAHRIADRLEEMYFTGCFELRSRAHEAAGEEELALQALEEGTRVAPDNWMVWQVLGNYLSDQGEFARAEDAYLVALALPEVDRTEVTYNLSLMKMRAGDIDEARGLLGRISGDELPFHRRSLELSLLNEAGRYADVLALGRSWLEHRDPPDSDEERTAQSQLLAELAYAHLEQGAAREAEQYSTEAIELEKANPRAMWVRRELGGAPTGRSRLFELVVEGRWHHPLEGHEAAELPGFMTTYTVVAEDVERALDYVRPFEPEPVRDSLQVADATEGDEQPELPDGVYDVGAGYAFYSVAEDDEQ